MIKLTKGNLLEANVDALERAWHRGQFAEGHLPQSAIVRYRLGTPLEKTVLGVSVLWSSLCGRLMISLNCVPSVRATCTKRR
jgi:hypothetical protein